MSLKGTATGTSRAAIIETATKSATEYYNTPCVVVELTQEHVTYIDDGSLAAPHTSTGFTADWLADIGHVWEVPVYGFPKCRKCGKQRETR